MLEAKQEQKARGRPMILVVDDDPDFLELLEMMLFRHLKIDRITTAPDALQASMQAEALNVGLVITDLVMPGFGSGVDLYRVLREKLGRELPFIFLTAVSESRAISVVPAQDPRVLLLYKPLRIKELIQAVRELAGPALIEALKEGAGDG